MLNRNHPQTKWIFAASRHDDAVLTLAKLMTLLPTIERQQLLGRIARHIERLHRLNREHFNASAFIERAISDLESACRSIANLQSGESRLDGRGTCPVCSSAITDLPDHDDVYCARCLDIVSDARRRLDSSEGFGTWAI
jgi:hypothetical protein